MKSGSNVRHLMFLSSSFSLASVKISDNLDSVKVYLWSNFSLQVTMTGPFKLMLQTRKSSTFNMKGLTDLSWATIESRTI